MALNNQRIASGADAQRTADDASDQEEQAMVNDYQEQVQYDDGGDLERTLSFQGGGDIQAQLSMAAARLDYGASLDVKLISYDNYCNMFHFILNSEGPVDLDAPSVSAYNGWAERTILMTTAELGLGGH